MKLVIALALIAAFQVESATAQTPLPNSAPSSEARASARDDLIALRDFLGRDRSYSAEHRAQAEILIDTLERRVDEIGPVEMALAAARIAALADNGHTIVVNGIGGPTLDRLPYRLALMQGRLYILDPGDDAVLMGAEVLAVDGVPVDQIRQAFYAYRGGIEAWRDAGVAAFVETPEAMAADGVVTRDDPLDLTVRTHAGELIRRRVSVRQAEAGLFFETGPLQSTGRSPTAPNGAPQPLYLRDPDIPFFTSYAPDAEALYVALRATRDQARMSITEFLATTRSEIETNRPRNIILDLRFNFGGDLNTARSFAKALPSLLPADGRVFVITSGTTFSAAISTLGYLKEAGGDRVVIVGEPVGDRLEFWAEGDTVDLPYSGAMLLYATERHNYHTGCPEDDCHGSIRRNPIRVPSLQPDLPAPMTVDHFMGGRDPAMEAITAHLGRMPATP